MKGAWTPFLGLFPKWFFNGPNRRGSTDEALNQQWRYNYETETL